MGIVRYGATAAIRAAAKSGSGGPRKQYPRQPGIVSFTEEMRDPGRAMREMRAAGQWGPQKVPRGTVAVPAAAVARPAAGPQAVTTMSSAPVDGARVLNQAYGYLGHMAVWPSAAAQITATLYAAAAHAVDEDKTLVWQYMPRMFYTSKEGGSGKSWMARLTASLCPDPKRLAEMTKASLIDLIAEHNTPVITELDVFVGTGKRNQWLTGLANVGYEFDGETARKAGGKVQRIRLFGPMILDGLDSVIHSTGVDLKTLMSRCIIVHVTRAPDGYRPPRYDREKRAIAAAISSRLARWMAQEVKDGIGDLVPAMPEGLGNRPRDLWFNLLAVAERAGGDWPSLAAYACEHIEAATGLPGDDEAEEARIDYALGSWEAAGPELPEVNDNP